MNILFITYHYLNGNGGGVFASRAYINAFAEIGDDVTLLYPMKEGAEISGINHKVRTIPVWDKRTKAQKYWSLLRGQMHRYSHIERYIGDEHYDWVVFDTCMVTYGLIDYFKRKGSKIITIHHNYQYEYFRDNTPFLIRVPTLFWTKIYERQAVRGSDLNLTLTQADKHLLTVHYGTGKEHIEVIGAFEYKKEEHPVYLDVKEDKFLITGSLGAVQTERSLLPWIRDYYPIIKELFPQSSLTLAGKSPSDKLIKEAEEVGIKIIASPKQMEPILAQARYYICATSLGGGLKLRVMDGLKAGMPVICHEVSARGYEIFADRGMLFVYNSIESFRQQLMRMKSSQIGKEEIIREYEREFLFENGVLRLKRILQEYSLL